MSSLYDCRDEAQLLPGMRHARQAIGRGELVVLPTDTVYGIAADAFNARAVQRLLDAKGRGRQSPPPVLVAGLDHARARSSPRCRRPSSDSSRAFWPGGLTIVLPSQPSLSWDLGDTNGTVAVRMPDNRLALELLEDTGPLAVSSANLTGKAAAIMAADAQAMLGDSVSVYLDGGPSRTGIASTIIDATSLVGGQDDPRVTVLREGAVGLAAPALGPRRPPRARPRSRGRARDGGRRGPARVKQYVFVDHPHGGDHAGALVGGVATEPALQALSGHPRTRRPQDADAPAGRHRDVPRGRAPPSRCRRHHPFFSIFWADPKAVLCDPRRDAASSCVVGVADDLWDLDWMIKLGAQFLAAGIIAWFGELQIFTLPIGGLTVGRAG